MALKSRTARDGRSCYSNSGLSCGSARVDLASIDRDALLDGLPVKDSAILADRRVDRRSTRQRGNSPGQETGEDQKEHYFLDYVGPRLVSLIMVCNQIQ